MSTFQTLGGVVLNTDRSRFRSVALVSNPLSTRRCINYPAPPSSSPPPPRNDIMQYLTYIFFELGGLAGKMGNAIMMHFRSLVDNGM